MAAFDEAKVKLIIEAATQKATDAMKKFTKSTDDGFRKAEDSAQSFGQKAKASWDKAKSAWVGITATVVSLRKAYQLMNTAARFKEREIAFGNMAASHQMDSNKIIADLKRISRGTIDTMTLMEKAGTAMLLGIKADKLDELMKIARASSKVTGQTVSQAFSDISLAVGRQSRMILDNLGIIVKVEDANKEYAATLKKVAGELTEAEKKQAFLNATMKAGEEIIRRVGDSADSAAERLQRYEARWKNISVTIGNVLLTTAMSLDLIVTAAAVAMNAVIASTVHAVAVVTGTLAKIPIIGKRVFGDMARWSAVADAAWSKLVEGGMKDVDEAWKALAAVWEKTKPARVQVTKDLKNQGEAAKKTADEIKKLRDLETKNADTRAAAIEALYEASGTNADAYYRLQRDNLLRQTLEWEKAGVDREESRRHLFLKISELESQALEKGERLQADWLNNSKFFTQKLLDDLKAKDAAIEQRFKNIKNGIKSVDKSEANIRISLSDDGMTAELDNILARRLSALQKDAQALDRNKIGIQVRLIDDDLDARLQKISEKIEAGTSALLKEGVADWKSAAHTIEATNIELWDTVASHEKDYFADSASNQQKWLDNAEAGTSALLFDFKAKEDQIQTLLTGVREGIRSLDGQQIGIDAQLIADDFNAGLQMVSEKIEALQAKPVTVTVDIAEGASFDITDSAGKSLTDIENRISDRMHEGVANWKSAAATIETTNAELWDTVASHENDYFAESASNQQKWLDNAEAGTSALLFDFKAKEDQIQTLLTGVREGIRSLDGQQIGIDAQLIADDFNAGLQMVSEKIEALQAKPVTVTVDMAKGASFDITDSAGASLADIENRISDRLHEGVANWKASADSIAATNADMWDTLSSHEKAFFSESASNQQKWGDNVQAGTSALVDDFKVKEDQLETMFSGLRTGIQSLDNSEIGIHMQLFDDGFARGIDGIIGKLVQLRVVHAETMAVLGAGAGIVSPGISVLAPEARIADDLKYGRSDLADPLGGSGQ